MNKLSIGKGFKEFQIGDDENAVIRVNTTDLQILARFNKVEPEFDKILSECQKIDDQTSVDETIETLTKCDSEVRKNIDYIFGSKISDTVFGDTNCVSFVGGQPMFMNFLDAIMAEIEKDINSEVKLSEKKIGKYTSQVKK